MTIGAGKGPLDTLKFLANAARHGTSVVWYRTFVHADCRDGFVSFTDLTDRALPAPDLKTCAGFEFSQVDDLRAGRLAGDTVGQYLVALTTNDLTIYRFVALTLQGRLVKRAWMRPRPDNVTGLVRTADGRVALHTGEGCTLPLDAP